MRLLLLAFVLLMFGCASAPADPLAGLARVLVKCEPCSEGQVCREVDGRPAACVPYGHEGPPSWERDHIPVLGPSQ